MSTKSPLVTQAQGAGTSIKKGSAWISARTSERAVAQQAFASDPKYKKYTQQVERCLNSFDNVHEWADCIAFLKQLLKTFQSYMQFKEIPRKLIVAKRLSQCLNPALPTGVHQRALDVYSHILRVLGTEGLKRDLPLWSSGLFPFFEYAATSVKPMLLDLYDTYYLPMQTGLRPIMKSFILALLPGLEEETSEFFDKVLTLLDRLSSSVSPSFFLQNIWLIMLTTTSARGTSLNFLSRRLPVLSADADITGIVGRDIGLMIRAFAAALEDDNLLVRRGALDILLQSIRVNSAAIKKAQPEDRTILMRAATGVVLRRDLSLNRRLYTWLLGPDEKSDQQIAYLKEYALDLLKSTLKDEMFSPSGDYSESRPFKIFISLLDKWEIGAALTDVLVYDAFKAIKQYVELNRDASEDVIMTASTLYEAVEPNVIWKQLLSSLISEIMEDGNSFEAIHMALFVLQTFKVQDEEIQGLHLPVVFSAIMDILNLHLQEGSWETSSPTVMEVLLLQEELLRHIPVTALIKRPELTEATKSATALQSPYGFACTFYGMKPMPDLHTDKNSSNIPFASAFEDLISLSISCGRSLASSKLHALRVIFTRLLLLISMLVDRLEGTQSAPIKVSWNPAEWFSVLLSTFELETTNFATVDRIVALGVALHETSGMQPILSINERSIANNMIRKLIEYLRPNCAVYHVRAVNLIWSLEGSMARPHAESVIAQCMTDPDVRKAHTAYEAFGVLWRLTEDNLLPGFRFKIPMMIVLDTLKNDDPSLRRIGETWMRCSLKSYLRVLDPILFDLLDPSIRRSLTTAKIQGKELTGFLYERPFDQRYIYHLLETLLSIVRFGGQGFAKTARSTPIRRTHHSDLRQRVETVGSHAEASYLDVLVDILLRFVQTEPRDAWAATMRNSNAVIQSTSIDLLQVIVARGEIDNLTVDNIEAAVISKLYFCIHVGRLDLQNKLLHILHSLISASTSNLDISAPLNKTLKPNDGSSEEHSTQENSQEEGRRTYVINPLLVQTLMDGIATPTNRAVLQHWLDFILMAIPQFQPMLQSVVGPLNDCVCRQLRLALADILHASNAPGDIDDITSSATDAEFIMLLNALERLVQLSLTNLDSSLPDDDSSVADKSLPENSGLLGYVSNVFSSDNATSQSEDQFTARLPGYRALREGVYVLYSIWLTFSWTTPTSWSSKDDSLSLIHSRTRVRCRRVLEHLFRVQSAEVLESVIVCWNSESMASTNQDDASFELVDVLIASAQNAVHMICESITCRISGSKKRSVNPTLSDTVVFEFLEQYLQRLEGPLTIQVWGRFLQLAKDIMGATRDFKPQNFPVLRCLCVLADKITQTTAMEDKRVRKELQETFGKLLDTCVNFVGRSSDQGTWIRRGTLASPANGRDSPIPRVVSDSKLNENITVALASPELSGSSELALQITQFAGEVAIPNLRKFLVDNDKIATACVNIVYYIVNPAMRGKSRPMEIDDAVVQIIRELAKIPAALKAWRGAVTELLNDNRVFNSNPDAALKWKPIIKALFDTDKTAFPELLGKVATAPSANIFTNREHEMLLRSLNLRRLSYVLFTGDKNHFLTQLPTIQEKLVDVLKNVTSPIVQSEVYLCIRVLLCRLSPHNLTSFWPVILTELYRVFEQIMSTVPLDGSEDLQLILSASKCLDLLLALQTEEFQIHQWIFITDTVDAVYRPDDWNPEAMMDQLSEIIGNLPVPDVKEIETSTGVNGSIASAVSPLVEPRLMRRPMLASLRQIDSIRDLIPFFSHVSIASYESVYASGGNIDWEAVERGLVDDMFDGR